MGLERNKLPDSLLKCVSPDERRAAGLPPPAGAFSIITKAKQEMKRERELQNQIDSWLRLRGITAIRSGTHKATSNNVGTPDFLFAVKGQAVALEAKLTGQKPTDDQMRMLTALAVDGWLVKVVHSLDEARYAVAEASVR